MCLRILYLVPNRADISRRRARTTAAGRSRSFAEGRVDFVGVREIVHACAFLQLRTLASAIAANTVFCASGTAGRSAAGISWPVAGGDNVYAGGCGVCTLQKCARISRRK